MESAIPDVDAGSEGGVARGYGPSYGLVCQDDEQRRVFELCKLCVERESTSSLYVLFLCVVFIFSIRHLPEPLVWQRFSIKKLVSLLYFLYCWVFL